MTALDHALDQTTGTVMGIRPPRKFEVLMVNDDYTPMDFVVAVLAEVFGHQLGKAQQIMLDIHQKGRAVCGVYTREMAEVKVGRVTHLAHHEGYPLICIMKPQE